MVADIEKLKEQAKNVVEKHKEKMEDIHKDFEDAQKEGMEIATGRDIPFDVEAFIMEGAIKKENLKVTDSIYIDMQTLSRDESVLAETMAEDYVKNKFNKSIEELPSRQAQRYYNEARMSIAILRINNSELPIPEETRGDDYKQKLKIMDILSRAQNSLLNTLMLIYGNLEKADVLIDKETEEPVGKKS